MDMPSMNETINVFCIIYFMNLILKKVCAFYHACVSIASHAILFNKCILCTAPISLLKLLLQIYQRFTISLRGWLLGTSLARGSRYSERHL
jgi:hypothetical protein